MYGNCEGTIEIKQQGEQMGEPMSEYKSKSWLVMADYGCGLWGDSGGCTRPDNNEINAPAEYIERFESWVAKYWDNLNDTLDIDEFDKEGRALAVELKKIVGPDIKVIFCPEASFSDDYEGKSKEEIQ